MGAGGRDTGCEVFLPVTAVVPFLLVPATLIPSDFFPSYHVPQPWGRRAYAGRHPGFEGPGAEGSKDGVGESGVVGDGTAALLRGHFCFQHMPCPPRPRQTCSPATPAQTQKGTKRGL